MDYHLTATTTKKKNKIPSFVATSIVLENIMLSEMSQAQKTNSFLCESFNKLKSQN